MAGDFLPKGTRLPDYGGRVYRVSSIEYFDNERKVEEHGTYTRLKNEESGLCASNKALKVAQRPDPWGREKTFKWCNDDMIIEVQTKGVLETTYIFIEAIDLDEDEDSDDDRRP